MTVARAFTLTSPDAPKRRMSPAMRKFQQTGELHPPELLERELHERCKDLLDQIILKPAKWVPYPAGVTQLSPQQQARYSRFGIKRGMPDIWILYNGIFGIELKRPGQKLSKTRIVYTKRGSPRILEGQEDVFPELLATGAFRDIAICHSVDEVLGCLDAWGVPHRRAA